MNQIKHPFRSRTVRVLLIGVILQTAEIIQSQQIEITDWGTLGALVAGVFFRVIATHLLRFTNQREETKP